jgi:predicted enzyme related to lactoylglutathione lyase
VANRVTMINRVAFVMYPVSDMARSVEFYRDVLGLEQAGLKSDFWVEFDAGGVTFGIGNFEQVGTPGTAQSLALEVPDMAAAREALASKGHASTEPFETQICFISMVRDLDGNQIWLHQSKPA